MAGIIYSLEGPQGLFHEEIDCLLSLTTDLSGQGSSDIPCKPGVSLSRQGLSLFPPRAQITYEYLSIPVLLIFSGSLFVQGNYFMCMLSGCDRNWKYINTPFLLIVQTSIRIKWDRRKSRRNYIKSWRPQYIGRFMAYSVSRRPLIAEAGVWSQASSCRICSGQSANVAGFTPSPLSLSVSWYQYYTLIWLFYLCDNFASWI
jgi:hypothetical protein